MWGWDVPAAILKLHSQDHKKLHDKQNIKYDKLREYRKQMNHLPNTSKEFKSLWYILLIEYFAGAVFLPAGLIRAQYLAVKKLAIYVCEKNDKEVPHEPDIPNDFTKLHHWIYVFVMNAFEAVLLVGLFL